MLESQSLSVKYFQLDSWSIIIITIHYSSLIIT